jgi:hypothetical protein
MLPPVPAEAIKSAMARFDAELRTTAAWANWQNDRRHKFAINDNGKLYPVKQVVVMATNAAPSSFGAAPRQMVTSRAEASELNRYNYRRNRKSGLHCMSFC